MEPFIGEIRIFAGNFAPRGWAFCNGQLLPINQFTALFSILGVIYGGNGTQTFALPNLQGRVPLGAGAGANLTPRNLGGQVGSRTVTLTSANLPSHTHAVGANSAPATADSPAGAVLAAGASFASTANTEMARTGSAGLNQPIPVEQPYLAVNFIIALDGIYPSRP
jgi:microcystin-dependent protein